jgi:hypothetical protein
MATIPPDVFFALSAHPPVARYVPGSGCRVSVKYEVSLRLISNSLRALGGGIWSMLVVDLIATAEGRCK